MAWISDGSVILALCGGGRGGGLCERGEARRASVMTNVATLLEV